MSKQSKHTPGPWRPVKSPMMPGAWDLLANGIGPFCVVSGTEFDENHQTDNAEANARLIAAAPEVTAELQASVELLEELRDCLAMSSDPAVTRALIQKRIDSARAIVAKATGGAA